MECKAHQLHKIIKVGCRLYSIVILLILPTLLVPITNSASVIKKEIISQKHNTTFIDKDYKSNLFKEDKYYSIKTIEKKLKIKLLHNDNIDSKLYKADFIKTKDNKIAKIIFENVKEKKNNIVNIPLCIIINTQYSDLEDRNYLDIIENTKEIKYHINSINVDATIMLSNEEESGPMFSFFIYENIIYEIYMNRGCNTIEDLYEILNSFYK